MYHLRILSTIVLLTLLLGSCNRIKKKTKQTIHRAGEVVGKSATEFFDGVGEGIDETLSLEVELSEALGAQGIRIGKNYIRSTDDGRNNMLTVYIIFHNDYDGSLHYTAFDRNGTEQGRSKADISGIAGDAGYFDIPFDSRTRLEVKGKVVVE